MLRCTTQARRARIFSLLSPRLSSCLHETSVVERFVETLRKTLFDRCGDAVADIRAIPIYAADPPGSCGGVFPIIRGRKSARKRPATIQPCCSAKCTIRCLFPLFLAHDSL